MFVTDYTKGKNFSPMNHAIGVVGLIYRRLDREGVFHTDWSAPIQSS